MAIEATWNWAADPEEDGGGALLAPDHRPFRKLPRGFVQPKDLSEADLPTDKEIATLRRWSVIDPDLVPADATQWREDFTERYATADGQVFAD